MTKENDVRKVQEIINHERMEIERVKALRKAKEEKDRSDRVAIEEELKRVDEEKLRATGVIELFKTLRDSKVVVSNYNQKSITKEVDSFFGKRTKIIRTENYQPANVWIEGNNAGITFDNCGSEYKQVKACLRNNVLIITGDKEFVVVGNLSMVEAVGKAIASPGHHDSREPDWGWD